MNVRVTVEMVELDLKALAEEAGCQGKIKIASVLDPEDTELFFDFVFHKRGEEEGLAITHDGKKLYEHVGKIERKELQEMSHAEKFVYGALVGIFYHVRGKLTSEDYDLGRVKRTEDPNKIETPVPMELLIASLVELDKRDLR
ncbi:MAG: hypothetical protein K0S38_716 [Candidatus Paceibacter sp.]|jgi:hypothetical protein|nr:hypothetical protein [Candidatus Paceibacter sp.]